MNKRVGISLILLVAFALLQAHNLIPHHHQEEPALEKHAHNDHDDDHDGPLNAHHSADFGKVVDKPEEIKYGITSYSYTEINCIVCQSIGLFPKILSSTNYFPKKKCFLPLSPPRFNALRAPPTCFD